MLSLFLLLLLVFVALTGLLYVGALFIQGYFYTEPGGELGWRAPAAAAAITVLYLLWCVLDVRTRGLTPLDVPYDTIFRFNRWSDMGSEPVKQLWVVRKGSPTPVLYERQKYTVAGRAYTVYKKASTGDNWSPVGVEAILIEHDGQKMRFERKPGTEGKYPEFVSDTGWIIDEGDEGPSGMAKIARTGRLLANVALNVVHFGLWFVCLWLVLRFQWAHALTLAAVLWLVATMAVLPPLLGTAANAAWQGQPASVVMAL